MNSSIIGKQTGSLVRLVDGTVIPVTAQVGRYRQLHILSTVTGAAGLFAGALLWAIENWGIGVVVATLGLVIAFAMWAFGRSK